MAAHAGNHPRGRRAEPHHRVCPDEPGALARVTAALGEAGINVESIDGRRIGELGVTTLRTSDDAAMHALLEANLRAVTSDAVVFHLPDRSGALAGVTRRFAEHQPSVRTIHIVHRHAGEAIVAVSIDDDAAARALLDPGSLL